ncbi:MAG: serine/threonine protein kinase [Candidatus Methylacidiphilales bacterium]|nr:serine/threonine protein kinase [Candidatus Methylacidiphilales bacterium]
MARRTPSHGSSPAWGKDTQFFYDLTPERTLAAIESTGLHCTGRVHFLNSMENRVVAAELESPLPGTSITYVVAKFYRPGRWTREQILEEHDFLYDLAEAEIPICAPLGGRGRSLHVLDDTGIRFSLFPRIGGRTPDELDEEQLVRVGRLMGRVHAVGASGNASHRITLGPSTYGRASLDVLLGEGHIPDPFAGQVERLAGEMLDRSNEWFAETRNQRIHGDAHLGNLLWTPEGAMWVDFDDMVIGPPVQDLWLLAAGREPSDAGRRDCLLSGYQEFHDFDHRSWRLIEPLRALRYLHFAAWISKRWQDPAFPRAFPFYGTPAYWGQLADDLRECCDMLEAGD